MQAAFVKAAPSPPILLQLVKMFTSKISHPYKKPLVLDKNKNGPLVCTREPLTITVIRPKYVCHLKGTLHSRLYHLYFSRVHFPLYIQCYALSRDHFYRKSHRISLSTPAYLPEYLTFQTKNCLYRSDVAQQNLLQT